MNNDKPSEKSTEQAAQDSLPWADLSAVITNPEARAEFIRKAREAGCDDEANKLLALFESHGPALKNAVQMGDDMLAEEAQQEARNKDFQEMLARNWDEVLKSKDLSPADEAKATAFLTGLTPVERGIYLLDKQLLGVKLDEILSDK